MCMKKKIIIGLAVCFVLALSVFAVYTVKNRAPKEMKSTTSNFQPSITLKDKYDTKEELIKDSEKIISEYKNNLSGKTGDKNLEEQTAKNINEVSEKVKEKLKQFPPEIRSDDERIKSKLNTLIFMAKASYNTYSDKIETENVKKNNVEKEIETLEKIKKDYESQTITAKEVLEQIDKLYKELQ